MDTITLSEPLYLTLQRHRALAGLLELILRKCELPPEHYEKAKAHYQEKTDHLKKCSWLKNYDLHLLPQGSAAIGTIVAPLLRKYGEFDIDLLLKVFLSPGFVTSAELHRRVGDRLRVNYANILDLLKLGWQLDYAAQDLLHFDVIPVVPWRHDSGVMMLAATDWKASKWKPTNPEDFNAGFLKSGEQLPFIDDGEYRELMEGKFAAANSAHSAQIDPLPENTVLKTPLQRMVQLTKRFRDIWYANRNALQRKTPSIVVTTLLWLTYEQCVIGKTFSSVFRVLQTMADGLTDSRILRIQTGANGQKHYVLMNPTVPDENLVARWNEPGKGHEADEFFAWVTDFRKFIRAIETVEGQHKLAPLLKEALGSNETSLVLKQVTEAMRPSPGRIELGFHPERGIAAASIIGAVPLKTHLYHGLP